MRNSKANRPAPWILLSILLVAILLASGCASADTKSSKPESDAQTLETISSKKAFDLIQNNQADPDFVILDVRTPAEFAAGHIENAVLIDFYAKTFANELDKLDKGKTYLVYCRSGNRSGQTLNLMQGLNFSQVYNIDKGINQWLAQGLPIVK